MTEGPASFGPVAKHYDLLMSHVPYDMWVEYYLLLLAHLDSHPDTLLDVCCGTGIVAEMLVDKGYDVTGFDLSPAMIAEARKKAQHNRRETEYIVADASTLNLGRQFDGAYSFFDSLNYITDPERLRKAILSVSKHLREGGTFVFDVNTAYAFEQRLFDQSEHSKRSEIHYDWVGDYDSETMLIRVEMSFKRGTERFHEVHIQRAYTEDELRFWLEEAGFSEIRAYDSYTLEPPKKKSDRLHFAAVLGEASISS